MFIHNTRPSIQHAHAYKVPIHRPTTCPSIQHAHPYKMPIHRPKTYPSIQHAHRYKLPLQFNTIRAISWLAKEQTVLPQCGESATCHLSFCYGQSLWFFLRVSYHWYSKYCTCSYQMTAKRRRLLGKELHMCVRVGSSWTREENEWFWPVSSPPRTGSIGQCRILMWLDHALTCAVPLSLRVCVCVCVEL
jgi:hypothetical protein